MNDFISIAADGDNYELTVDVDKVVALEKRKTDLNNVITIYTVDGNKFHLGCENISELNERYRNLVSQLKIIKFKS